MVTSVQRIFSVFAGLLMLAIALGSTALADTKCEAAGFVKSAGQAYDRAASAGSAAAFANAAARFSENNPFSCTGKFKLAASSLSVFTVSAITVAVAVL